MPGHHPEQHAPLTNATNRKLRDHHPVRPRQRSHRERPIERGSNRTSTTVRPSARRYEARSLDQRGGGTRTHTSRRTVPFEGTASADCATAALGGSLVALFGWGIAGTLGPTHGRKSGATSNWARILGVIQARRPSKRVGARIAEARMLGGFFVTGSGVDPGQAACPLSVTTAFSVSASSRWRARLISPVEESA